MPVNKRRVVIVGPLGGGGGGGGGGWVPMSLIWISEPVVLLIEEETMLLSVFYFCLRFSLWLSHFQPIFVSLDAISAFLCQGHVSCQNFSLTGPNAGKLRA